MSYIATLITSPEAPILTPSVAEAIANSINSQNIYWLADGIACDCVLPENCDPVTIEATIRKAIGSTSIDVVIERQELRRRKALIADMDSTMIEQECIDELAAEVGLKEQVSKITARAMNGEIPFEPALRERVALLKGLSTSIIEKVITERITLTPGARELVATLNANGAYTSLVSGGFSHFTENIAALLGFSENHANKLMEHDNVLTGEILEPVLGREAKIDALQKIAGEQGLTVGDFLAVGDGANDLGMLQVAGAGVAFRAKPSVAAASRIRIDHGDLTALLYMQGYRKADFAG